MTGREYPAAPDKPGPDQRRREAVAGAEPVPVTEAMITPRTWPPDAGPSGPTAAMSCPSCGESNNPTASYCIACGARIAPPPEIAGMDAPDTDPLGSPASRGRSGTVADGESPDGTDLRLRPVPEISPGVRRLRSLLVAILVIAFLSLGFSTLRSRDGEPESSGSTTPTSVVATTTNTGLRSYVTVVGLLADDVEQLKIGARRINEAWDNRTVGYATTLEEMTELVARTVALPARLASVPMPEAVDPVLHRQMDSALAVLTSTGEGMLGGLESSDTGEARLAQLSRFEAAAADFAALASQVKILLDV